MVGGWLMAARLMIEYFNSLVALGGYKTACWNKAPLTDPDIGLSVKHKAR
ncbi:hypothetical protein NYF23_09720 [SAR92 clade bacterium H455]|uniref:Uncharacterized protein n=1 Tax=SAR92 clade bacterium H455 TaxID=2974818 RepID=A0ABY5TMG3_9GAMM|nr:hypothetical protein NYF23_09720 [SAR92 clade bacterium H455]